MKVNLKKIDIIRMIKGGNSPEFVDLPRYGDLTKIIPDGFYIKKIGWYSNKLEKLSKENLYKIYLELNCGKEE